MSSADESTTPRADEPEAAEPQAAEPEAVEPEAAEPQAAEPEAVEPEAPEPEAVAEAVETPAQASAAVEAAPSAPAVEDALEPAPVDTATEAPAVEAVPEPAAVEAAPEPAAGEAAPEHTALEASPVPAAVEAAPEAPAVQAAPEHTALEASPVPAAVEAAPEAAAVQAAPVPAAVEAAPEVAEVDAAPEAEATPAPAAPVPAARPVPRPSPAVLAGSVRPAVPVPAAAPAAPVVETPDPPSDSARFGRVDDDGTVHVTLPDGSEASVGQWAAGTPAEGLAFFVRKYDDLSVEVDLATRRLREGKAAPDQAAAVVKRVREALASPSMVGDLASLGERVEALEALVAERRKVVSEERAAAKAAALAAREAIVAEAEQLAESTQWKATGERFKTLLEEWKSAPRADRTGEQALWKRFSHARSQFDKQVKEALADEAEALSGSTDWGATAGAYRDLMTRWKAAGRAGKADEETLWSRFRAAQDAFFAARSAAFGERDAGFAENLAAKEALLAEAEAIDTSHLKTAKAALRGIQERWESIGHVPRGDKERIEGRLRKIEDAVRKGEEETWRRTNPEAKARAEATVAQFQGSLDKLEKEKAKAEAAGDARKVADAESRIATTKSLLEAAQRAATEFGG